MNVLWIILWSALGGVILTALAVSVWLIIRKVKHYENTLAATVSELDRLLKGSYRVTNINAGVSGWIWSLGVSSGGAGVTAKSLINQYNKLYDGDIRVDVFEDHHSVLYRVVHEAVLKYRQRHIDSTAKSFGVDIRKNISNITSFCEYLQNWLSEDDFNGQLLTLQNRPLTMEVIEKFKKGKYQYAAKEYFKYLQEQGYARAAHLQFLKKYIDRAGGFAEAGIPKAEFEKLFEQGTREFLPFDWQTAVA